MSGTADSDDDIPQLSAEAMAALQEFYRDQVQIQAEEDNASTDKAGAKMPQENWQLSQFWYDEETSTRLANEVLSVAGQTGSIACISCPTLYHKLRELKAATNRAVILEYDARFKAFGEDFIPYDYNSPLELPLELKQAFDIVVADPPFLSEECLTKTAITVRYMAKEKVILCTGAVMEELALRLLQVEVCPFEPRHTHNLGNDFRCYTNYTTSHLNTSR